MCEGWCGGGDAHDLRSETSKGHGVGERAHVVLGCAVGGFVEPAHVKPAVLLSLLHQRICVTWNTIDQFQVFFREIGGLINCQIGS